MLVKTIEQLNKNSDKFCLVNNFDEEKLKFISKLKYEIKMVDWNYNAIEIYPGDLVYEDSRSKNDQLVLVTRWGGVKELFNFNLSIKIKIIRPSSLSILEYIKNIWKRKNITYEKYNLYFFFSSFIKIEKSNEQKRVLFITSTKKSDGIYSVKNYSKHFGYKYIETHKLNFKLCNSNNFYAFFAKNFIDFIAALYANNISTKTKFLYFSLAGAPILSQLVDFTKFDYKTIHIAHGRISSNKFLHRTNAVITSVPDKRYSLSGIKQFRNNESDTFRIKKNGIYLFLHGYEKGKPYSTRNLINDLILIKKIYCNCKILKIKIHPTATLLYYLLKSLNFGKIQIIESYTDYTVEKIFCSSPTYSIQLCKQGVPIEDLSKL